MRDYFVESWRCANRRSDGRISGGAGTPLPLLMSAYRRCCTRRPSAERPRRRKRRRSKRRDAFWTLRTFCSYANRRLSSLLSGESDDARCISVAADRCKQSPQNLATTTCQHVLHLERRRRQAAQLDESCRIEDCRRRVDNKCQVSFC